MEVLEDYQVRLAEAEECVPYGRNSRTHSPEQVLEIEASMREWGWTNPMLLDVSAGMMIIAGHGRQLAALKIYSAGGEIKLPSGAALPAGKVPFIDCSGWSEAQRRAYVIADNKLATNAGWDVEMLKVELADLMEEGFDLALTGFREIELADLLEPVKTEPKCDPDEIPEPAVTPFSKRGDLWLCGEHRVLCGDSTSAADVALLLGDAAKADHCWTDPPYLMNFEGAVRPVAQGQSWGGADNKDKIKNDKLSQAEGEAFLRSICTIIKDMVAGTFYVSFYRGGIEWMMRAMTDSGLKYRNLIIWKKNNHNLSNSDYKSIYEPVFYGFHDDYHAVLYGWNKEHLFRGGKAERDVMEVGIPSVWEIDKTKKNAIHPTVKPVALVERSIINSSLPGQTWLDLFGGSGTTLIACELTARKARLMELEPKYVDTICRRYHAYTGQTPIHAESGEPFPIEMFGELPVQK